MDNKKEIDEPFDNYAQLYLCKNFVSQEEFNEHKMKLTNEMDRQMEILVKNTENLNLILGIGKYGILPIMTAVIIYMLTNMIGKILF